MGLSAAEKNRRKRERKKKEKEEERKRQEEKENTTAEAKKAATSESPSSDPKHHEDIVDVPEIEIEYVVEEPTEILAITSDINNDDNKSLGVVPGLPQDDGKAISENGEDDGNDITQVLRRFNERAAVILPPSGKVTPNDDEKGKGRTDQNDEDDKSREVSDDDEYTDDDDDNDDGPKISIRKKKALIRPTVAALKSRVKHPELVEAHDITAPDPEFLIELKAAAGTTPVPRHWGRKRKYLQGKRGYEKKPFELPEFIIKTGITEVRDTIAEDEAKQSAKQKNRGRVNPKMGQMDVDYKVLYDAFFKYQTKPRNMTKLGDLYYEGKELETSTDSVKPGKPLSQKLREALGMLTANSPPPWLHNMQRFGPPPSYPGLKIPGLNAPLPNDQCQYGYHVNGWGKPPMDAYGRPLFGGNPLDPPGCGRDLDGDDGPAQLVTSDGKTVAKSFWGALPTGDLADDMAGDEDESSEEENSSDEDNSVDMEESDEEEEEEGEKGDGETVATDGMASVLPPPRMFTGTAPGDLRKAAGDETPMPGGPPPKQLYQVLETKAANGGKLDGRSVFQSDVQYVVPGGGTAAPVPEGAESVLSKAVVPNEAGTKKRKAPDADDDEDGLDKNFKF